MATSTIGRGGTRPKRPVAHGRRAETFCESRGETIVRVLLTGHEGYIGTVLAPLLVRAGHEVVGLDSGLFAACTYAGDVAAVPSIDKDIRDVAREDLMGFDAVLHLAGLSNDPLGDLDPELTYDINHKASVRLAEYAKAAGAR